MIAESTVSLTALVRELTDVQERYVRAKTGGDEWYIGLLSRQRDILTFRVTTFGKWKDTNIRFVVMNGRGQDVGVFDNEQDAVHIAAQFAYPCVIKVGTDGAILPRMPWIF